MAEPSRACRFAITPEVEELIALKMSDAGISYRVIADQNQARSQYGQQWITQIRQRRKQAESEWLQESVSWCAAWAAAAERCSKAKTAALTDLQSGANSGIGITRRNGRELSILHCRRAEWRRWFKHWAA